MKAKATSPKISQSSITRILIATAFILLIPFLAMQFSSEVAWSFSDFAISGALLIGTGLIYELSTRKLKDKNQQLFVGAILANGLFLIWLELAVGIFGTPFGGR